MKCEYMYEPGAVRYVRVKEKDSPFRHKPPMGWRAMPIEMDFHPITFAKLQTPVWFIRETFIGE